MNDLILKLIAEIDEFRGHWYADAVIRVDQLNSMRRYATIESIGSSTRIEGSRLSDEEVEKLLSGVDIKSFRTRDEQEVAGYADAMKIIYESYNEMPFTEPTVKGLHKILLKHSIKDEWHLGEYKTHPNHVSAFDESGREIGVIFETSSPFDTPIEMENLTLDINRKLNAGKRHRLLIISEFILRFLAIHPFQDGNGRLSRILTNMLLLQQGYSYIQYSSLERLIEANKADYYKNLHHTQVKLKEQDPDLNPWHEFFLLLLKKQKDLLLDKMKKDKLIADLPELSQSLLELTKEYGRLTVSQAVNVLGANRNTVKAHFQKLVAEKRLSMKGRGRGSYYITAK